MEYDVVPIIYGDADYANVLPPDSYINVMDFGSPEDLADYLWNLSHDSERYLSFSSGKIITRSRLIRRIIRSASFAGSCTKR
jgi:Glycosyltransferase family 10 (fucosyltransferase).